MRNFRKRKLYLFFGVAILFFAITTTHRINLRGNPLVKSPEVIGADSSEVIVANSITFNPYTVSAPKTRKYLKGLNVRKYETQGISLLKLPHRTEPDVDNTYDYDFERLDQLEKTLIGVDRRKVLAKIFHSLVNEDDTNTAKYLSVLSFLQKVSYHNIKWQPMHRNQMIVSDPLLLLELADMRCGHISRLAADLFAAGGYETRVVQLGGHIIAEVFYDGSFHYIDADIFGGGQVAQINGKIPSTSELSEFPEILDRLQPLIEYYIAGFSSTDILLSSSSSGPYPSYNYFGKEAYGKEQPLYYHKTASLDEERDQLYGWGHYDTVNAPEIKLADGHAHYYPGPAKFDKFEVIGQKHIKLGWQPSDDRDNDLIGYRVYVSEKTRGWFYNSWIGAHELSKMKSHIGDFTPDMYEKLFLLPPHDVGIFTTQENEIEIHLPEIKDYYVTVMPYDSYGESIGKTTYPMSNEILISSAMLN